MNSSMGFLKPVTSTLKKYKALAPSVIITTVAVLLLLLVVLVFSPKAKEAMAGSVRMAGKVQKLQNNVPSRYEPRQIRVHMDKLEEQANKIKELAVRSGRRDLITYEYKIFPEPDDPSQQIYLEFGEQYRIKIETLIETMNALDAPSQAEIRAKTGGGKLATGYGGRGTRAVAPQDPRIDALCLGRAQEVSVYANPLAFAWYPFWDAYEFSGKSQALEDCWDSQIAFWVYEDIVDTIKKMNGDTGNVLSVPVKRLLGIRFAGLVTAGNQTTTRGHSRTTATTGLRDRPSYAMPDSPSVFLDHSLTGRLCNDEVDVIHCAVSVLLDSRFIFPFMKELCSEKPHSFYPDFVQSGQPIQSRHNQITILQSDLKVIDKMDSAHELYRYGKGAVVRLDLICEYQFNRAGYDAIKPNLIKKQLGQPEDTEEQNDTQNDTFSGIRPGSF